MPRVAVSGAQGCRPLARRLQPLARRFQPLVQLVAASCVRLQRHPSPVSDGWRPPPGSSPGPQTTRDACSRGAGSPRPATPRDRRAGRGSSCCNTRKSLCFCVCARAHACVCARACVRACLCLCSCLRVCLRVCARARGSRLIVWLATHARGHRGACAHAMHAPARVGNEARRNERSERRARRERREVCLLSVEAALVGGLLEGGAVSRGEQSGAQQGQVARCELLRGEARREARRESRCATQLAPGDVQA